MESRFQKMTNIKVANVSYNMNSNKDLIENAILSDQTGSVN